MQEPRIEFPCRYPIKVIGESDEGSVAAIVAVVQRHAPETDAQEVSTRLSRDGNFQSVRFIINATGEEQLQRLHKDLMSLPSVRLVL